jgi:hypothetical protein
MTAAKESKTRGTIAKLDAAMLDIFESYQERFDNITINNSNLQNAGIEMEGTLNPIIDPINGTSIPVAASTAEKDKAREKIRTLAKLHFIHDIMRMEMPFRWEEVTHNRASTGGKICIGNGASAYHVLTSSNPPVLQYYQIAYDSILGKPNTAPQSSELLFLIIANLNPEALENFHGSEIGDIDGNGLHEFHDAWGNPIQFIRFAPAFTGSDLQPDVVTASNYPLGVTGDWVDPLMVSDTNWDMSTTSLTSPQKELVHAMSLTGYSDPFDPTSVINRTWFMYPLIVSGGADGLVDLCFGIDADHNGTPDNLLSPFVLISTTSPPFTSTQRPFGLPCDETNSGKFHHYDNIHNHRSSNSF